MVEFPGGYQLFPRNELALAAFDVGILLPF